MRHVLMVLLFCLCWTSSAFAETKRLAVLEFTGIGIDPVVLGVISDSARAGIVNVVNTDQVLIMTRESISEILKDMGKDASCLGGACEVETGRNIGADYIMVGSIAKIDDQYIMTLKFLDTQTGGLLASETVDAVEVNILRKITPELAQKVVIKGLKLEPKTVEQSGTVTSDEKVNSLQVTQEEGRTYNAVLIPAGEFLMGCTPQQGWFCQRNEIPAHQVKITQAFYMMESEVTQKLYKEVMGENPSPVKTRRAFFPVTKTRWHEAAEFANELSRLEGLDICYSISRRSVSWVKMDCNGWRLPTEAEWEYAARGGKNQKYSGSDWFRKVAHGGVFTKEPIAVCSKNKNDYGLCDMSGNVQEWTWDKYKSGTYRTDASDFMIEDPIGPKSGFGHVTRGGAFKQYRFNARVST